MPPCYDAAKHKIPGMPDVGINRNGEPLNDTNRLEEHIEEQKDNTEYSLQRDM